MVDDEGLAIASGREVRGSIVLPPTRAGWQKYLELAPKSGESYQTLREIGLQWWDRKIPQNLLKEASEQDEEAAPPAPTKAVVRDESPTPSADATKPYEEMRRAIEALGLPQPLLTKYREEIDKAQALGFALDAIGRVQRHQSLSQVQREDVA